MLQSPTELGCEAPACGVQHPVKFSRRALACRSALFWVEPHTLERIQQQRLTPRRPVLVQAPVLFLRESGEVRVRMDDLNLTGQRDR
jgi:hypothetical protein